MPTVPPWLWGPAVGVLGIVIGLILFLIGQRRKGPRYLTESVTLVGPAGALPNEVQILFSGKPVPKVTRTDVIFWNAGRLSIRKEDVISGDPVKVCLPEGIQILGSRVVKKTAGKIVFEVCEVPPNCIRVEFDHLGHEDGGRIEVLHTGDASSVVTVSGTIADARIKRLGEGGLNLSLSFSRPRTRLSSRRQRRFENVVTIASFVVGLSALYLGLIHQVPTRLELHFVKSERTAILMIGFLYMFAWLSGILAMRRRYPRELDVN